MNQKHPLSLASYLLNFSVSVIDINIIHYIAVLKLPVTWDGDDMKVLPCSITLCHPVAILIVSEDKLHYSYEPLLSL